MKVPRCAPAWLMAIAQDLIKAGAGSPGVAALGWIPNWNVALHWIQHPTYCALSYQCDGDLDDAMRNQIMDAFARGSQKKLVAVADRTTVSAICFYGGAPSTIPLDTFDFEKLR